MFRCLRCVSLEIEGCVVWREVWTRNSFLCHQELWLVSCCMIVGVMLS